MAIKVLKTPSQTAQNAGYRAGKSIGNAHPGSPAAHKMFNPPSKHAAAYTKGWRKGAYEAYSAWLTKNGKSKREIPSPAEVFRKVETSTFTAGRAIATDVAVPSSGTFEMPAQEGLYSIHRMSYQSIGNGSYVVRSRTPGGEGPNPFAKGSIVSEREMANLLAQAR